MSRRGHGLLGFVLGVSLSAGCAVGPYSTGTPAAALRDWDETVTFYREALVEDPGRADYRIALARATLAASRHHLDTARRLEAEGAVAEALVEYERALECDPSNTATQAAIARIQREFQGPTQAARPSVLPGREGSPPLPDPTSAGPLTLHFVDASLRHILDTIGNLTGINVVYDAQFQDRPYSVRLEGVALEEVLSKILAANGYFW